MTCTLCVILNHCELYRWAERYGASKIFCKRLWFYVVIKKDTDYLKYTQWHNDQRYRSEVYLGLHTCRCGQGPWWPHQMEALSALLALCAGNSSVTGEFPWQRPVTRNFDVFFYMCLNKRLSKQSWGWWLETSSHSIWRHRNAPTGKTVREIKKKRQRWNNFCSPYCVLLWHWSSAPTRWLTRSNIHTRFHIIFTLRVCMRQGMNAFGSHFHRRVP